MGDTAGLPGVTPDARLGLALWAWVSLFLIPVFFLVAMGAGYVLYDLFGYPPENAGAPLWVDLAVDVPVLIISLIPCIAAVRFGRLAAAAGSRSGLPPLLIAALAGVGFTVMTVIDVVVR